MYRITYTISFLPYFLWTQRFNRNSFELLLHLSKILAIKFVLVLYQRFKYSYGPNFQESNIFLKNSVTLLSEFWKNSCINALTIPSGLLKNSFWNVWRIPFGMFGEFLYECFYICNYIKNLDGMLEEFLLDYLNEPYWKAWRILSGIHK